MPSGPHAQGPDRDGRGGGDVERVDAAAHRDPDDEVGGRDGRRRQTVALGAMSVPYVVPRGSAKRVLLVEDNADVVDMLAAYLQELGHEVIHARDGRAGLDVALQQRPEVIVCDIGLPGLDGYEIARRVRQTPEPRDCVLIAVSGYGDSIDRERARQAGFDHHLTKPADPVQLADLIAKTSEDR